MVEGIQGKIKGVEELERKVWGREGGMRRGKEMANEKRV